MKIRERLASKHPNTTHGLSRSVEYGIWSAIKRRCLNKNCQEYQSYGGRGISVCKRWVSSFESFLKDVGLRPSTSHSIERMNNSKGYSPGNVRWATAKEQQRNKRTNVFVTIGGVRLCVAEWCGILNISNQTVSTRVNSLGWSYVKALTTPTFKRLTVNGKTKPMSEWARLSGVSISTIWARVRVLGWTPEQSVNIEPRLGRNQHA